MSTPARHRRGARWPALVITVAAIAALQAIAGWRERHAIMINMSDSLPNWAFFLTRGVAPARGQIVFFEAPPSPVVRAHFGARPAPFGKLVLGMPGQIVRHAGRRVTIDDRVVGWTKPRTRRGWPLVPGPAGVIPPNCFYVGSRHPDGFDSRYAAIGFVCRRQLIGVGEAIL